MLRYTAFTLDYVWYAIIPGKRISIGVNRRTSTLDNILWVTKQVSRVESRLSRVRTGSKSGLENLQRSDIGHSVSETPSLSFTEDFCSRGCSYRLTSSDTSETVGPSFGAFSPTNQLFEPIWDIPLTDLTCKVFFLVAFTSCRQVLELAVLSCRELFFVLHKYKVVLSPNAFFLPKMVSGFHLNEDII